MSTFESSPQLLRAMAIACALLASPAALTQEAPDRSQLAPTGIDYDTLNTDWNGLSELYREEMELGRELEVDQPVDLSTLSPSDVLVIVYPTTELPVADLMAFVEDGGALLLADDFGTGGPMSTALELTRRSGVLPHSTFVQGNPALPLVRVDSDQPLLRGVRQIVGNHPAWLTSTDVGAAPVIPLDSAAITQELGWQAGLLYDLQVGEGRAVVLADPSILINLMIGMADNRALVRNIVDGLCVGRAPCRLTLVTRDTPYVGSYPRPPEVPPTISERLGETFKESFARMNTLLGSVAERRPQPRGVFYASFFLGLGICVFLFSVIPLLRPKWLDFSLKIPDRIRSRSEFEWNLERLAQDRRGDDFGLPLAILKDEFEELFLGALAQHDGELQPERRQDPDQQERFARRFAQQTLPDASRAKQRKAAVRALATIRAMSMVPSRNNLVPNVDERYSERLFKRLYRETRALLHDLDLWDEYERRTGRP